MSVCSIVLSTDKPVKEKIANMLDGDKNWDNLEQSLRLRIYDFITRHDSISFLREYPVTVRIYNPYYYTNLYVSTKLSLDTVKRVWDIAPVQFLGYRDGNVSIGSVPTCFQRKGNK